MQPNTTPRRLGDKTERQHHTTTMANKTYTKLFPKWVRNTYKKQDPDPPKSSSATEKHQMADSSPDRHPDAISRDAGRVIKLGPPRLNPSFKISSNDDTQNPFEQVIVASSFDMPDNTPLLSHNSLESPPTSMGLGHGTEDRSDKDPRQTLLRAIIVGGGPTGLILAHALHKAGISYTLLEQAPHIGGSDTPDVIQPHENGTSLLLWPDSARVLDQLGLLRRVEQISCPVRRRTTGSVGGEDNDDVFARLEHEHGRPCMLVDRASLLHMLYDSLPDREARVRTGKQVVSVETHDTGVKATCKDGSVYQGSVVVGCDGVHSIVRQRMCELRAEGKRKTAKRRSFGLFRLGGSEADKTMEARYYGLIGTAPMLDGLEAGVFYETRCDAIGATFQAFTSEDKV